jgi:hypothetical protein
VSSLEDYAIEIVQEIEKDFNAMGQESFVLTNQRKAKKPNQKLAKMHHNLKTTDNKMLTTKTWTQKQRNQEKTS